MHIYKINNMAPATTSVTRSIDIIEEPFYTSYTCDDIEAQQDKQRIVKCKIVRSSFRRGSNDIWVRTKTNGCCENNMCIYTYYRDEIYFSPDDFIGLSLIEAMNMIDRRDYAYLAM